MESEGSFPYSQDPHALSAFLSLPCALHAQPIQHTTFLFSDRILLF